VSDLVKRLEKLGIAAFSSFEVLEGREAKATCEEAIDQLRWRSVESGLPEVECNTPFLCHIKSDPEPLVLDFTPDENGGFWNNGLCINFHIYENVTHWIPLPGSPE